MAKNTSKNSPQTQQQKEDGGAGSSDMVSWKPGSEPEKGKDVGGRTDFGVAEDSRSRADRDYASTNTKRSDPGATQPFDWEHDGRRDHGAGARDSGPGSGSGGDLDTDVIGFGTGGGVAQSPADEAPGPDDSDGTSNEFASPVPAAPQPGMIQPARGEGQSGPLKPIRGSVVQGDPDMQTGSRGQGADAVTNPARDDDSFAGEVSSGEAQGEDLPVSPSSDTQGLVEGDNQLRGAQKDERDDA